MKRINTMLTFIALFLLSISQLHAQAPSGKEILEKVDQNMSSENRVFTSKMVIHGRRGSRTVASKSWAEGEKKAFTTYLGIDTYYHR